MSLIAGCYMRAEVFSKKIIKRLKKIFPNTKFDLPKKHFVFGGLSAKSNSTLDGKVRWRYHVAPIVRLNDGMLYILDPALSANAIGKDSWYRLMDSLPGSRITGYVTCDSATYGSASYCFHPEPETSEYLESQIQGFLAM